MNLSPKEQAELDFWRSRPRLNSVLAHDHYEFFYTEFFGLNAESYRGKTILDIGCGPRGSLEWATTAALRIGLDPLSHAFTELGTTHHAMQYVAARAEHLPFADKSFDFVTSFNSLDHVDDLEKVIKEMTRVLAPSGTILLLTDIHDQPTVLEPAAFSWDIIDRFHCRTADVRHFEHSVTTKEGFGDIYQGARKGIPYDHTNKTPRYGILAAKLSV
ncbi:MAG: class I SAM-dependent methyltransferase [Fimbriimonas sp.]